MQLHIPSKVTTTVGSETNLSPIAIALVWCAAKMIMLHNNKQ